MSHVAYITRVRARPGKRAALIELNLEMQRQTAGENGVLAYNFHTAKDNPDEFWYYDLYASPDAFEKHCATPAYQQMMARIGELADISDIMAIELEPFAVQGETHRWFAGEADVQA